MGKRRPVLGANVAEPLVSVIIPAYNEEGRIWATLEQVVAYLTSRPYAWEVVVADDGSTDGTVALVTKMVEREPRARLVQAAHGGKGSALREGIRRAEGEYLFLCDADLSMPIQQLGRFIPPALSGYDLAIGSREVPGARRFREPRLRHVQGRVFNALVRLLVVPGFADTQCGFKSLRGDIARQLLPFQRVKGFSFDVELLFLARRKGFQIVEVPIDWYYQERSRMRPFIDAAAMVKELLAIRWNGVLSRYRSKTLAPPPGPPTGGGEESIQETHR